MATPEEDVSNKIDAEALKHENGHIYDEDEGIFLGQLTDDADVPITLPPAQLSVFIGGYWYVYKVDHRVKEGE